MFDLGWSELAVIALVALIIVGPRELPEVLRTVGKWVRKARSMAREFQSSVDDMVREAELDEARKTMESARHLDIGKEIENSIDPTGSVKEEVAELDAAARRAAKGEDEVPPEFRDLDDDVADDKDSTGAKVVEQPAQPAPPHSIVPPEQAPAEEAAEAAKAPAKSRKQSA